jgi:hypothetical protein
MIEIRDQFQSSMRKKRIRKQMLESRKKFMGETGESREYENDGPSDGEDEVD